MLNLGVLPSAIDDQRLDIMLEVMKHNSSENDTPLLSGDYLFM